MGLVLNKLRARYTTPTVIPADLGVLGLTTSHGRSIGPNYGDAPNRWGTYNIVRGRMGWMQ